MVGGWRRPPATRLLPGKGARLAVVLPSGEGGAGRTRRAGRRHGGQGRLRGPGGEGGEG